MPLKDLAQAATVWISLLFPDQQERAISFHLTEASGLAIHSSQELGATGFMSSIEGEEWARRFSEKLRKAATRFQALAESEPLLRCAPGLDARASAPLSLFLVPQAYFPSGWKGESAATGRRGFDHPANPGMIIEASPWDLGAIEFVIVHESVHRWCAGYRSNRLDAWGEEGAADWIAGEATGRVPRLSVSRYFAAPSAPTLYGSSYLWFVARAQSQGESDATFLNRLAELHLGLRPDLVYGKAEDEGASAATRAKAPAERTPFGQVSRSCADSGHCLVYRLLPWGEVELAPYARDARGYWVWHGPLPAGLE